MEVLKINETPVRTSRNFKINNLKLENIELPCDVHTFNGFELVGEAEIIENATVPQIKYGLGDALFEHFKSNVNSGIRVKPISKSVILRYDLDDSNRNLINYVEIIANRDIDVIIEYSSSTNYNCFVSSIINLISSSNSHVNISVVNLLNESSNFFIAMDNTIEDVSNVDYTIIDLGAKNSAQNYFANILGEGACNNLQAIYLGRDEQVKDLNYIAELRGEKTDVYIDVQGALKDCAKKNFKGTIDFKKGCKKAKGDENEYCMLLSDRAKSIALPMLLCTEDDVEGNHATASGKLDDKEIFYIMSRGIEKKDATKLIVKAKFNKIIERISNELIKEEVLQEIDRRLD